VAAGGADFGGAAHPADGDPVEGAWTSMPAACGWSRAGGGVGDAAAEPFFARGHGGSGDGEEARAARGSEEGAVSQRGNAGVRKVHRQLRARLHTARSTNFVSAPRRAATPTLARGPAGELTARFLSVSRAAAPTVNTPRDSVCVLAVPVVRDLRHALRWVAVSCCPTMVTEKLARDSLENFEDVTLGANRFASST